MVGHVVMCQIIQDSLLCTSSEGHIVCDQPLREPQPKLLLRAYIYTFVTSDVTGFVTSSNMKKMILVFSLHSVKSVDFNIVLFTIMLSLSISDELGLFSDVDNGQVMLSGGTTPPSCTRLQVALFKQYNKVNPFSDCVFLNFRIKGCISSAFQTKFGQINLQQVELHAYSKFD